MYLRNLASGVVAGSIKRGGKVDVVHFVVELSDVLDDEPKGGGAVEAFLQERELPLLGIGRTMLYGRR